MIVLSFFGANAIAQENDASDNPAPLPAWSAGGAGDAGGDAVVPPAVIYCVLPDYGSQTIFYAPLHTLAEPSPSRLSRLSLRFVRSVNAQQQRDLALDRKACSASPTPRAASSALTRTMAPLLSQGYVAVVVGIF